MSANERKGDSEQHSALGAQGGAYRAAVPCCGVFDYGKSQAGASGSPRAPLVDAVETLKNVRQMLRIYSAAVVGHVYFCICRRQTD